MRQWELGALKAACVEWQADLHDSRAQSFPSKAALQRTHPVQHACARQPT